MVYALAYTKVSLLSVKYIIFCFLLLCIALTIPFLIQEKHVHPLLKKQKNYNVY